VRLAASPFLSLRVAPRLTTSGSPSKRLICTRNCGYEPGGRTFESCWAPTIAPYPRRRPSLALSAIALRRPLRRNCNRSGDSVRNGTSTGMLVQAAPLHACSKCKPENGSASRSLCVTFVRQRRRVSSRNRGEVDSCRSFSGIATCPRREVSALAHGGCATAASGPVSHRWFGSHVQVKRLRLNPANGATIRAGGSNGSHGGNSGDSSVRRRRDTWGTTDSSCIRGSVCEAKR
jgi:hypothetical protein